MLLYVKELREKEKEFVCVLAYVYGWNNFWGMQIIVEVVVSVSLGA